MAVTLPAPAQLPAFPGAEGFGKFATGARGGSVYHVTTLADSGSGSFRDAVSVSGRTVVFDIGGVIDYQPPRYAPKANITIAGQTAPGDGVTLYGNGLSFSGANNSICRFLRVREGINGDSGTDAMGIANGHDMIFDHMSISWGRDETFSVSGSITNITIQSCVIAQGLQTHSAGGLIQADGGVSILRCFYIDNDTRNPKVKFVNEFVNNVVYNWDAFAYNLGGDSAGDSYVNAFNNYFINGPAVGSPAFSGGNLNFHIYATNNWQDANLNGVLDGAIIPLADYGPMDAQAVPFAYPLTHAFPPLTALKLVISDAGTSWKRDVVDERMLTELTSWGALGETVNSEYEAPMNGPGLVRNGTPYPDTDQDGMPDFWENGTGSNPAVADHNNPSPSGSGYTRLEDYLNWLADPHGIALTNTAVEIELRQFTRGFTNTSPVFSLSGGTNGSVSLTSGGRRARFIPTPDYSGPAGFSFTVMDADGSTLTRPMNLFFTPSAQGFTAIWRGDDVANNWNTAGDFNWFNGQSLLFPFRAGDSVLFDDSGSSNPDVNLVGSLQPALLTFDAAKNYSFGGGSLDGAMALNKTGTGTFTLNTTNNFSGPTTVSNGTLLVHGTLSQSTVTVRRGGTLGGHGRLTLAPILETGASLAPGNSLGDAGTLTISNALAEAGGVINRFDLTDDPTGLIKANDQLRVVGGLNLSGVNPIQVNLLNGPLANGLYTLITYSGALSGGLANLVVSGANGTLTNPPGQIALLVDNSRPPASLSWLGALAGNVWDNGTNANWMNGANQDRFYFGDAVLFDDTGSTNAPVTLVGALAPNAVTVNVTKNYTFSGTGKITGTTGLTKTNSGTLTISTVNDYVGVTALNGGVVSVAQLANGGVASGLGAAATNAANLAFDGGTLRYTGGSVSMDRAMTLGPNGGTLDVTTGGTTLTLSNGITGSGSLTKLGSGRLDVSVNSDYSGGTQVYGGVVRLASDSAFGSSPITLNGTTNSATLRFGSDGQTLGNTLNVIGTNNFSLSSGNDTIGDLIGSGTLHVITNSGATWTMAGNLSGFSGTIVADAIQNVRFNPSTGGSNAVFDLGNNTVLLNNRNGGLTIQLGALSGGPKVTLQGASSANSLTTYVIGGRNLDTTFAGKITEVIPARTAAITKVGTGTFTLTGANTHTGPTIINAGTLLVNNPTGSATGTNSVTVNSGGTLGGNGFIFGPVVVNSGGALSPGSNSVGQLTLKSNLTLNAGAILNFDWAAGIVPNDKIAVSNALVLNGTLNLSNRSGFGAGTYTLINYGGALSGSLPVIGTKPAGFSCTLNTNTPGQVRLVVTLQAPAVISDVTFTDGSLIFGGTGPANDAYFVLNSTNLALPLAGWVRIATNQFRPTGTFRVTNAIAPGVPQNFYRLQVP